MYQRLLIFSLIKINKIYFKILYFLLFLIQIYLLFSQIFFYIKFFI